MSNVVCLNADKLRIFLEIVIWVLSKVKIEVFFNMSEQSAYSIIEIKTLYINTHIIKQEWFYSYFFGNK